MPFLIVLAVGLVVGFSLPHPHNEDKSKTNIESPKSTDTAKQEFIGKNPK